MEYGAKPATDFLRPFPGAFPRWLKEFAPTWFTAGPALHRTIVALLKERGECAPAGPRFLPSIGAAMPDGLRAEIESALGVPVVEGYGLTEAGAVTSNPLPPAVRKLGSAGRSTGAGIAILDAAGIMRPPGVEGEIAVRGACVSSAVLEAAVFGMPHPTLGEDVGAAVVLRPGAAVSERELRRFAAACACGVQDAAADLLPRRDPEGRNRQTAARDARR